MIFGIILVLLSGLFWWMTHKFSKNSGGDNSTAWAAAIVSNRLQIVAKVLSVTTIIYWFIMFVRWVL